MKDFYKFVESEATEDKSKVKKLEPEISPVDKLIQRINKEVTNATDVQL